jgi:hypothetical protein
MGCSRSAAVAVQRMAQSPSEMPGGDAGITRRQVRLRSAMVNGARRWSGTYASCAVGSRVREGSGARGVVVAESLSSGMLGVTSPPALAGTGLLTLWNVGATVRWLPAAVQCKVERAGVQKM